MSQVITFEQILTKVREEREKEQIKKTKKEKKEKKEKKKRAPSAYNLFVKKTCSELKTSNPEMNYKQRFMKAIELWSEEKEKKTESLPKEQPKDTLGDLFAIKKMNSFLYHLMNDIFRQVIQDSSGVYLLNYNQEADANTPNKYTGLISTNDAKKNASFEITIDVQLSSIIFMFKIGEKSKKYDIEIDEDGWEEKTKKIVMNGVKMASTIEKKEKQKKEEKQKKIERGDMEFEKMQKELLQTRERNERIVCDMKTMDDELQTVGEELEYIQDEHEILKKDHLTLKNRNFALEQELTKLREQQKPDYVQTLEAQLRKYKNDAEYYQREAEDKEELNHQLKEKLADLNEDSNLLY